MIRVSVLEMFAMLVLSQRELEAISQRVLKAYWKREASGLTPCRVNPEVLLKDLLGLQLEYRCLSEDGLTLGMTAFERESIVLPQGEFEFDGKTVLVDSSFRSALANEGRRNFTIVHEGVHHILRMLYPRAYACGMRKRVVVCRAANSGDPEERQIDALTALLLMPEDLLRQNLAEAGLPGGISILAYAFGDEYLRFDSVRKRMGVSRQALAMRMQKLGLLGKNSLELPEIRCPGSW